MSGAAIRHPLTGATFEVQPDGNILVYDAEAESTGLFSQEGNWVSGELTYADNHMIRWALDVYRQKETKAMAVAGNRASESG